MTCLSCLAPLTLIIHTTARYTRGPFLSADHCPVVPKQAACFAALGSRRVPLSSWCGFQGTRSTRQTAVVAARSQSQRELCISTVQLTDTLEACLGLLGWSSQSQEAPELPGAWAELTGSSGLAKQQQKGRNLAPLKLGCDTGSSSARAPPSPHRRAVAASPPKEWDSHGAAFSPATPRRCGSPKVKSRLRWANPALASRFEVRSGGILRPSCRHLALPTQAATAALHGQAALLPGSASNPPASCHCPQSCSLCQHV